MRWLSVVEANILTNHCSAIGMRWLSVVEANILTNHLGLLWGIEVGIYEWQLL